MKYSKAVWVFNQLSISHQQFVTMPILEYAERRACPDVFLLNVSREYIAKKMDGATAASAAYARAAKLFAQLEINKLLP